jgi:hypothetical protein
VPISPIEQARAAAPRVVRVLGAQAKPPPAPPQGKPTLLK